MGAGTGQIDLGEPGLQPVFATGARDAEFGGERPDVAGDDHEIDLDVPIFAPGVAQPVGDDPGVVEIRLGAQQPSAFGDDVCGHRLAFAEQQQFAHHAFAGVDVPAIGESEHRIVLGGIVQIEHVLADHRDLCYPVAGFARQGSADDILDGRGRQGPGIKQRRAVVRSRRDAGQGHQDAGEELAHQPVFRSYYLSRSTPGKIQRKSPV